MNLELKAYAKINLTLDIIRKKDDGYHEIKSIMQQVTLFDTISIKPSNSLTVECKGIPEERNIAYKAAYLLKKTFNVEAGALIKIDKKIPIAAGLSGGSSDAAAVLKGLNELWGLDLTALDLAGLGKELGMDVPFSVVGGTCIATNRGEIVRKIEAPKMYFVLINPGIAVSTKEAYSELDLEKCGKKCATDKMVKAFDKDIVDIGKNMHNDFEFSVIERNGFLDDIKKDLINNRAINSLMTGSGPTVYGLFETKEKAKEAYERLKGKYTFVSLAESVK